MLSVKAERMPDTKKFIECDSGSDARMQNGPEMHGMRKKSLCPMMSGFAHTHLPVRRMKNLL